jgi:hypothetical protein
VSGLWDKIVKVYNLHSVDVLWTISTGGDVFSVQISTLSSKLMHKIWGSETICNVAKNSDMSTVRCNGRDTAISLDGKCIASGSGRFVKISSTPVKPTLAA